jgi:hypothetical protein
LLLTVSITTNPTLQKGVNSRRVRMVMHAALYSSLTSLCNFRHLVH